MNGRRKILAILILALLSAAILVLARQSSEPEYQRRRLSYWIDQYVSTSEHRNEAAEAIRAIGTNGLPYLITWAHYKLPAWRSILLLTTPLGRSRFALFLAETSQHHRADAALHAISLLGTNAAQAVPSLANLAFTTPTNLNIEVIITLSHLGPAAVPVLLQVKSNSIGVYRRFMSQTIAFNVVPTTGINDIPWLIKALEDDDVSLRNAATNALFNIAPQYLHNSVEQ
jgi:hypothetical protein